MRVLITGTREATPQQISKVAHVLMREAPDPDGLVIIHGGARGVDTLAHKLAVAFKIESIEVKADWDTHGKAAGPIRNQRMLDDYHPDLVLAFPSITHPSRGTTDMMRRAAKAGVPVVTTWL